MGRKSPVAYFAEVVGFAERSVVGAVSRGNARYMVFLSLRDANYDRYGFQHIKVRRAHSYDNIAAHLYEKRRCIGIEYADKLADHFPWNPSGK